MKLATLPSTRSIQDRFAALSRRERLLIGVGAATVSVFALYVSFPADNGSGVELAPVVVAPPPLPAPASVVPPPIAPAPPAASPAGLILHGVMGGGAHGGAAILGFPGGGQRVVPIGRQFLPGLTLKEVGIGHIIFSGPGGDSRLELNRFAGSATPVATAVPAGSPVAAGASSGGQDSRRETLAYRVGLAPHKEKGRITGFAIKPGANLSMLQRAGLKAGDVLVSLNGTSIDTEERLNELSYEISTSWNAEFEYIRNGRRMKSALQVNKRPAS